jgi:hypothetical protein
MIFTPISIFTPKSNHEINHWSPQKFGIAFSRFYVHDLNFCHLLKHHNSKVQLELGAKRVNFSRLLTFMHKLDSVVVHSSMISKECNWGAQLKTLCTMNLEVALLEVL